MGRKKHPSPACYCMVQRICVGSLCVILNVYPQFLDDIEKIGCSKVEVDTKSLSKAMEERV